MRRDSHNFEGKLLEDVCLELVVPSVFPKEIFAANVVEGHKLVERFAVTRHSIKSRKVRLL